MQNYEFFFARNKKCIFAVGIVKKMQPSINTTIRKNDVYSYGIREAFFSTISSKNVTGRILAFACRQRFSSVSASCSFTGKELDSETGYGYYGARYMDYELMTGWLSVDPLADKYPNISPYHYCSWNPVKLVDPNGQEDWEVDKLGHITKCQEQLENPTEDRIRKKGTDGWSPKNSISGLPRGTITEQIEIPLIDATTEYGSAMVMYGTQKDREDIFKFCANNANVEFTLMEIDDGSEHLSLLTTSHDEHLVGKDQIGDGLGSALAIKYYDKLQLHMHNHFVGDLGWGANIFDYNFRDNILNLRKEYEKRNPDIKLPEVSFKIYKCTGNDKGMIRY